MSHQFISLGKEKISYFRKGAGTTMLFLHGYGVPLKYYDKIIDLLAEEYLVVAPEIYGLNNLNNPPNTLRECAILTESFCQGLGVRPSIIVGHSLGGGIALEIAKTNPEIQKLILMNPLLPVGFGIPGYILRGIYKHIRAMTGITGGIAGVQFGFGHFFPFLGNFFRKLPSTLSLMADIADFSMDSYEVSPRIFILSGEKDEYFPVKEFGGTHFKKNISHEIYQELSHDWPIFYPKLAAKRILEALRRSF